MYRASTAAVSGPDAMVEAERLELIVRRLLAMKAPKARSEQALTLNTQ